MTTEKTVDIQLNENLVQFFKAGNIPFIGTVTAIKKDKITLDFDSKAMFQVTAENSGAKTGDVVTFDETGKSISFKRADKPLKTTTTSRSGSNVLRTKF